jgi:hypothetical protein
MGKKKDKNGTNTETTQAKWKLVTTTSTVVVNSMLCDQNSNSCWSKLNEFRNYLCGGCPPSRAASLTGDTNYETLDGYDPDVVCTIRLNQSNRLHMVIDHPNHKLKVIQIGDHDPKSKKKFPKNTIKQVLAAPEKKLEEIIPYGYKLEPYDPQKHDLKLYGL